MKKSRLITFACVALLLNGVRYCIGGPTGNSLSFCSDVTSYKLTIKPPLLGRSVTDSNFSLTAFDYRAHGAEYGCLERTDDNFLMDCQSYGMEKSQPLNGTWQLERQFYFNKPYGMQSIGGSGLYTLLFTNGSRRLAISEVDLTIADKNWEQIFQQMLRWTTSNGKLVVFLKTKFKNGNCAGRFPQSCLPPAEPLPVLQAWLPVDAPALSAYR